ncbi:35246_t:CDS:1, partial [Racocetra persica]
TTGHIQTYQNVFYLIDILLVKGLINQEVELKVRTPESSILVYSYRIIGIRDDAKEKIKR